MCTRKVVNIRFLVALSLIVRNREPAALRSDTTWRLRSDHCTAEPILGIVRMRLITCDSNAHVLYTEQ